MKYLIFFTLILTTYSGSWISLEEDGNLYTEKRIIKKSKLPKVDWKQWQHGIKQGLNTAKHKYRSAMRHQSFSVPGMHRPKIIPTIDTKHYYKSATYFYHKSSINDARTNPAFLQWRLNQ